MRRYEIENLAVMFRTGDVNLGHVSVLEQMKKLDMAYVYGVWRGIPRHYRKKRAALANSIAHVLSVKAKEKH